jgi:hypothetical protein
MAAMCFLVAQKLQLKHRAFTCAVFFNADVVGGKEKAMHTVREDALALAKLIFDVYKNPEENGIIMEDIITNDEKCNNKLD